MGAGATPLREMKTASAVGKRRQPSFSVNVMTVTQSSCASQALTFAQLTYLSNKRAGKHDIPCPICANEPRRSAYGRRRKVLRVWWLEPTFATFKCARCDAHGWVADNCNDSARVDQDRLAEMRVRATRQVVIDDAERTRRALAIWNSAHDPRGTPVEIYLKRRGLELPDEAAGEVIRFHAACPFAGARTPAMICLVRDIVSNEPRAVHRTALDRDGRKREIDGVSRLSLGPISGGAIKVTPDEDVTSCIGIGEGLETVLSLRHAIEFGRSPIWSVISAGGIETFPVLSGIETLWIAVDQDESGTGQATAGKCADRWRAGQRDVYLITPKTSGTDLNTLVMEARS
jgi:putative DNA primase/helicase